jgi:hypothetical protein
MTLTLALTMGGAWVPSTAATPEPVDAEFLDYLGTVDGKDHNWTVVATEKERKKAAADKAARPKPPPADAGKTPEVRP